MKLALFLMLVSGISWGRTDESMSDFNKMIMEDVRRDLQSDNAEDLKVKELRGRTPASVDENQTTAPENKTDKLKQLGPTKW